jgi:hypothetical protein|tara:strand:+ start:1834 stop:2070 length:237 start_codon:yes stop_codon:yes gene_type:complete
MQNIQTQALTWPLPTGIAASNEVTHAARANHYLATTNTTLANGVSVVPNSETLKIILQGWDDFGVEVVISSDSFIIKD